MYIHEYTDPETGVVVKLKTNVSSKDKLSTVQLEQLNAKAQTQAKYAPPEVVEKAKLRKGAQEHSDWKKTYNDVMGLAKAVDPTFQTRATAINTALFNIPNQIGKYVGVEFPPKAESTADKISNVAGTALGVVSPLGAIGGIGKTAMFGTKILGEAAVGAGMMAAGASVKGEGQFEKPGTIGLNAAIGALAGPAAKGLMNAGKLIATPLKYIFNPVVQKAIRNPQDSVKLAPTIVNDVKRAHTELQTVFGKQLDEMIANNPDVKVTGNNLYYNLIDAATQTGEAAEVITDVAKSNKVIKNIFDNPNKPISGKDAQSVLRWLSERTKGGKNPVLMEVKDVFMDTISTAYPELKQIRADYGTKVNVIKKLKKLFGDEFTSLNNIDKLNDPRSGQVIREKMKEFMSPDVLEQIDGFNWRHAIEEGISRAGGQAGAGVAGGTGAFVLYEAKKKITGDKDQGR